MQSVRSKQPPRRWLVIALALVVAASGAAAATPRPAAAADVAVASGATIASGQTVTATGTGHHLVMQADGNLVLYHVVPGGRRAAWAAGTAGRPGSYAVQQTDGNLVVYQPLANGSRTAVWASGTSGRPGTYLVVQDDGNAVLYQPTAGGRIAVWATGTAATAPVDLVVATFNGGAGAGKGYAGYRAAFDARTVAIADQEICQARVAQTNDPRPMAKDFTASKGGCGASGPGYGNAVRVAWSSADGAVAIRYRATDPDDGEPRSAICRRGVVQGRSLTFCSTHLTAGTGAAFDDARRSQQAQLLDLVARVRRPGDLVVVAGDFNSRTTSVMSANGLGLRRVAGSGSIDQIWSNGAAVSSGARVPCAPAPRCSDHDILQATIRW